MEEEFGPKRWAIVAAALIAAVAIGGIAYQAGVSQGIALQPPPAVSAPAAPGGAQAAPAPYVYDYRYDRRWRGGFGWFGPVFSILLFVFFMRAIFWGLFGWGMGWGWRRRWGYFDHPDFYGPSRFDDWHRHAHERMHDDRPAPPHPGA